MYTQESLGHRASSRRLERAQKRSKKRRPDPQRKLGTDRQPRPRALVRITPRADGAGVGIFLVDPLLRLDAKLAVKGDAPFPMLPPPPAHIIAPAVYEEIVDGGGMSNVGFLMHKESSRRR